MARLRGASTRTLPDLDTRARLLHVGQELARAGGLRGITVRGLAQAAGINLGTFVYHFGTREAFIAEVIEHLYAPLYARLQAVAANKGAPLARVRELVAQLIDFAAGNAGFVLHVIADAAAGEAGARKFMQALASRHPALLLRAIRQAQAARLLPRGDSLHMMVFLMMAVAFPFVAATGLLRSGIVPRDFAAAAQRIAADAALARQRLDWALLGLQPRKEKR